MNWFGSMVWYILNVFVTLFIHYLGLFWASEQAFLYRETVRSDRRKSLYRSMEKAFLHSCFLIIVMHVMLSGWLSGLYRIIGILVYMRACGCLVAYNVLSWGWLCIIMQSVDGFFFIRNLASDFNRMARCRHEFRLSLFRGYECLHRAKRQNMIAEMVWKTDKDCTVNRVFIVSVLMFDFNF